MISWEARKARVCLLYLSARNLALLPGYQKGGQSMKACELHPGDLFRVEPPDPEGPVRVCLTNDEKNGLRFGFPNNLGYWCHMGSLCEVFLVEAEED